MLLKRQGIAVYHTTKKITINLSQTNYATTKSASTPKWRAVALHLDAMRLSGI